MERRASVQAAPEYACIYLHSSGASAAAVHSAYRVRCMRWEYAGGLAADKKGVGDAAGTGKRRKADLADLLNLAESAVQAKDIHRS